MDDKLYAPFSPLLRWLAQQGVARRQRRGTVLMAEGDAGGSLYFVLGGLLRAYTTREDGNEFSFGFYSAGETLGEMSLDGGPRSASVVVEEDAHCALVALPTLQRCVAEQPALAFELLNLVCRRGRQLSLRARDLALNDAYGRLVLLLRAHSQPQPDGSARMPYALTQDQMAQQIGCARSMVTKLLGDLVKGGYLRKDGVGRAGVWVTLKTLPARY